MEVDYFIGQLNACNNVDCCEVVLSNIAAFYELDYYIYTTQSSALPLASSKFFIEDYPPAWWERYLQQNYYDQDAVVQKLNTSSLPFIWSDLVGLNNIQQQITNEAFSYGIVDGISLPVHTPTETASLSFAISEQGNSHVRSIQSELFFIAHTFHSTVIKHIP